jgi:hypothetical protein
VPFSPTSNGILVHIRLAPKASFNRIGGLQADANGDALLKVAVTAAPESGKANAALIRLLAKDWRLPKSAFAIAAGASERRKVMKIEGNTDQLMAQLTAWTAKKNLKNED